MMNETVHNITTDKHIKDEVRRTAILLKSAQESIRRSMGNGIAQEDMQMFMRALCNDVEKSANALLELVGS